MGGGCDGIEPNDCGSPGAGWPNTSESADSPIRGRPGAAAPIDGHYYACEQPKPGSGDALRDLAQRYFPSTDVDLYLYLYLIMAMFATTFWGERPERGPPS